MQRTRASALVGNKEIIIETGKLAKQAGGSVTVQCGDTVVLVTATAAPNIKEGVDFLPLTVDFVEKTFAAGKIPGGFFKREGRPTEVATLVSRFIDRPLRPMFPEGYCYETQVIATVLSYDQVNDPDTLAIIGASAALILSDVPFPKPLAGCRVGRINGQWVINATAGEMEQSDIDLIVAGTEDAIVMVEGSASEVAEKDMIEAILTAHKAIQPIIQIQKDILAPVAKEKKVVVLPEKDKNITQKIKGYEKQIRDSMLIKEKQARYKTLSDIKDKIKTELFPAGGSPEGSKPTPAQLGQLADDYEEVKGTIMRQMILKDHKRIDGRSLTDIRPISCEVGVLPRTHGSGLFTRGETQALVVVTLGSTDDAQTIDSIAGESSKTFMLHYNFPPFSVGEVKFLRSPGRREIGHGALAERALVRMLPNQEEFPYTIRIVSEILESNGSSSMATVCGGSLSLMDAGVPLKAPVAGIAMGLIKEGGDMAVLSDILGDEDHLGDMDFKVTGTAKGITALQMDIKIGGVDRQVMEEALEQARVGRLHILEKMKEAILVSRDSISKHAPRIETMTVKQAKIKDVIGSGGKNIRGIIDATGVKIDIEDTGLIKIFSADFAAIEEAKKMIKDLVAEAEVGKIYEGVVRRVVDFGAFVEILPKTDGLVHISQLANYRVNQVTDVVKEGDTVRVKCIGIDERGKVKLSMKDVEPSKEEAKNS